MKSLTQHHGFFMRLTVLILLVLAAFAHADELATKPAAAPASQATTDAGWINLFNGKNLSGWKASENQETWWVETDGDGPPRMVTRGPRAHLFYVGDDPAKTPDFKDFEFRCEVLTKPGANSGFFLHTAFSEEGSPGKGYEVQINNSHTDPRRTGGLFAVADIKDPSPAKDNEWFEFHVIVRGKTIVVKINDKVITDFSEGPDYTPPKGRPGRHLSHGTIALQGHDPGSEIHFRNVMIKRLP